MLLLPFERICCLLVLRQQNPSKNLPPFVVLLPKPHFRQTPVVVDWVEFQEEEWGVLVRLLMKELGMLHQVVE